MSDLFVVEPRSIAETFGLRESYPFSQWEPRALGMWTSASTRKLNVRTPALVRELHTLLACCSSGTFGIEDTRRIRRPIRPASTR